MANAKCDPYHTVISSTSFVQFRTRCQSIAPTDSVSRGIGRHADRRLLRRASWEDHCAWSLGTVARCVLRQSFGRHSIKSYVSGVSRERGAACLACCSSELLAVISTSTLCVILDCMVDSHTLRVNGFNVHGNLPKHEQVLRDYYLVGP